MLLPRRGTAARAARWQRKIQHRGGDGPRECLHDLLVADRYARHKPGMEQDGPFDRRLRRLRRDRAAKRRDRALYLPELIADELNARLDIVTRSFADVLLLGCGCGELAGRLRARGAAVHAADAGFLYAREQSGVQCDEDRLPIADSSCDLIISVGVLDQINDLPGALILIRRALRPNGLFLAAFGGAGSLPRLKSAMLAADLASGSGVSARIHPQIDVRAAGDLLVRAGFGLPVVDSHRLTIRFSGLPALVGDLRSWAATNILASRPRPLGRIGFGAALFDFAEHADEDGKTSETVEIIHVTAWNTRSDEPAAVRGGAAQPPAETLSPKAQS